MEIAEEYDDVPTFEEFKEITQHPAALDAVKELIDAFDKQGTLDFSGLVEDGYIKASRDPDSGEVVPVTTKVVSSKDFVKTVNIG